MIKQVIYVRNPEEFANGSFDFSLAIMSESQWDEFAELDLNNERMMVAVVEVDETTITREQAAQVAVRAIDVREQEIRAKTEAEINELERRKANLLSLPAPEAP